MTLLALAVGGRGLVDPDEPVLHVDDEAFLRGRAAFETMRVYGGRPVQARRAPRRASRARRHGSRSAGSTRTSCARLARARARGRRRAGRGAPPLRHARPRRSGQPDAVAMVSTLPEGLDELRARGIRLVSIQLGLDAALRASSPWLLGGVKSTSYAVNMAAEAEAQAPRRRRRGLPRLGRRRPRRAR